MGTWGDLEAPRTSGIQRWLVPEAAAVAGDVGRASTAATGELGPAGSPKAREGNHSREGQELQAALTLPSQPDLGLEDS